MKKPKNVQQPQHHRNDHDCVQDGLNRSLHWYESVDQPKQNTHHNQNNEYLKQRHELLTFFSSQAGPSGPPHLGYATYPYLPDLFLGDFLSKVERSNFAEAGE